MWIALLQHCFLLRKDSQIANSDNQLVSVFDKWSDGQTKVLFPRFFSHDILHDWDFIIHVFVTSLTRPLFPTCRNFLRRWKSFRNHLDLKRQRKTCGTNGLPGSGSMARIRSLGAKWVERNFLWLDQSIWYRSNTERQLTKISRKIT